MKVCISDHASFFFSVGAGARWACKSFSYSLKTGLF